MVPVALTSVSLLLSVWASVVIVRQEAATISQKVTYLVTIWLIPIIGAVIAFLGSLRFRKAPSQRAAKMMVEAVADKGRTVKTT